MQAVEINQAVLAETSFLGIPSRAALAVLQTTQKYGHRGAAVPALEPRARPATSSVQDPSAIAKRGQFKKLKISPGMEIACCIKTIPFQEMKVI